jgi:hypothetical protein
MRKQFLVGHFGDPGLGILVRKLDFVKFRVVSA